MVNALQIPLFWFNLTQDISGRIKRFGEEIQDLSIHAPATLSNIEQSLMELERHISIWRKKLEVAKTLEFDNDEIETSTKSKQN